LEWASKTNMIKLIPNLPHPVLGIKAKGKVTSRDYRSMFKTAVKEKLTKNAKISLHYHLGDDFENYEPGSMWKMLKWPVDLSSRRGILNILAYSINV